MVLISFLVVFILPLYWIINVSQILHVAKFDSRVFTVKIIIYQVLRKTMRVFQEFEEVTSGLNGLCIARAREYWDIVNGILGRGSV